MIKILVALKSLLVPVALFLSFSAAGQYYYNQIVDAKNTSNKMKAYIAARVLSVTAYGYDAQGAKTPDFNEIQDINTPERTLKIATRNGQTITRQMLRFDSQLRLSFFTDSSTTIKSVTNYTYDENDHITLIKTVTKDSLRDFDETEEFQWSYNSFGKPGKMLRIVNGKDSMEYIFSADEKGNVADEQLVRRRVGVDPVYYYYNDQNQLTDIVRYDKKAKKLLPDFMFEYDEQGHVIQRITTLSTTPPNYLIWRYAFNEKGLKTKEVLFNKQKEQTGKIEYTYKLAP